MRDSLKNLANRAFLAGDRIGVHVLPAHYYSSVASRRDLKRTEQQWRRPLSPVPFEWDLDEQIDWTRGVAHGYATEVDLAEVRSASEALGGWRYGEIEAQVLHSVIRLRAPGTIVEIGSGSSTLVMSLAAQRNSDEGRTLTKIVACDPYTADRVAHLPHVEARAVGGTDVDETVLALEANDILFIDSTHTVRTGSELAHLYLEVLPRLRPGVLVHIHDIYLPYLFGPDIYRTMFDWQETALLAALLVNNDRIRVLSCLSALHHGRPDQLGAIFRNYSPSPTDRGLRFSEDVGHFPSSTWLEISRSST